MVILDACRVVWSILPGAQRRRAVALGVLLTLAAVGDLVAVASWYPFTKALLEPGAIEATPWLAAAYAWLGLESVRSFQIVLGFAVILALVAGTGLQVAAKWWTTRFGWDEQCRLSALFLGRLVHLPHLELLARNSSEMSRDVTMSVGMLVHGYMLALARIYTSCIFTAATVLTFLVVNPWMALAAAFATGFIYAAVYGAVQYRLDRLAKASHGEAYHVVRTATEALCLVKEARCPPHRVELSTAFRGHLKKFNDILLQHFLLDHVPTPLALATAQVGVLLVLVYMVLAGAEESRALLAVFAVALAQLVPEVRAIYRGVLELRRAQPLVNAVATDLVPVEDDEREPGVSPAARASLTQGLRLEEVTFQYDPEDPEDPEVIHEVTLELPVRRSLALVGETGAGKTTLADLVAGVLVPTSGRVLVDGVEMEEVGRDGWRAAVGYVPQDVYMTEDSIRRNIAFGLDEDAIDDEAIRLAARAARIHDFVETLPEGFETVVGERGLAISGGQRQRIGIARALYRDPALLILDEATSALDSVTEASIFEAVEEISRERAVLVIAHRLSSARRCDRICLLEAGRVVAVDTYDTLLAECPAFRELVEAAEVGPEGVGVAT
jgi:ABC-type multidrug transport system fused ATPase/permease subunit